MDIKGGIGSNSPLLIYQPFNFIIFLSFYSPIILAVVMVSLSFIFQNFKGFIFLGFLIGFSVLRNFIYPNENKKEFDEFFEKYGNSDLVKNKNINFYPVSNIQEALKLIIVE
jgi:hypothetical protein